MRDLYDSASGLLYAVHFNGSAYAAFSSPSQALPYVRGMDAQMASYFHIEDEDGNEVVIKDQPRHPGHAYAVLASVERAERAKGTGDT